VAKARKIPIEPPSAGPDSSLNPLKIRAVAAARAGAEDEEIVAVLRVEVAEGKLPATELGELRRSVARWGRLGLFVDARTAGRLVPVEALMRLAEGGDSPAAVQLNRRMDLLDGLDPEIVRFVKRLLGMEPAAVAAEWAKLGAKLGHG
jgi:hypothetical protein